MFELKQVSNENLSYYLDYEETFETDLKRYQSRIYPSKDAEFLSWYHIKVDKKYIGAVWLERNGNDDFAVLGIFIVDENYRNKGIGRGVIEQIIKTNLQYMYTNKVILRVREENTRAIKCYKSVGFKENRRFAKDDIGVIEMVYGG